MRSSCLILLFLSACTVAWSQKPYVSQVWVADNGDGTYTNPVLHADYSDPDVIRVGSDFFLVSSSFEDVPGLPILTSKDLVNWKITGHALGRLIPVKHYSIPRHGDGVWAPSIRFHNGKFYIYYPDPDYGIYCLTSASITGPWSEPVLVAEGKGLIDPCPLWDDDGNAYLVHAFAGSRAGIKSILAVCSLSADGFRTTSRDVIVYDGHGTDPTIEGPKFYKRNGWYYIFAPAGGVTNGWQLVLRSRNIYGPYERKEVMDQGKTKVNGPHQGAWVNTESGEDWFLHFQDRDAYGRVVHLQPMRWINDWPVIGEDADGDGRGEPVMHYRKPKIKTQQIVQTPAESDEFNSRQPGLQWQWMANPEQDNYFMMPAAGCLRLYAGTLPDSAKNIWGSNNVLLQKFPAEEFMATAKMKWTPAGKREESAGITIMGLDHAGLGLSTINGQTRIVFHSYSEGSDSGKVLPIKTLANDIIYLRVIVSRGANCQFSFSEDGISFHSAGENFIAKPGKWKGAKLGIYCAGTGNTNDAGYADFDWFRIEKVSM